MRAVKLEGPRNIAIREIEGPHIGRPTDVVPTAIIADFARLVVPGGWIAIIGVFLDEDLRSPGDEAAKHGIYPIPWGTFFKKGVAVGMGRDHDKRYNDHLRDAIVQGRMKPSSIVSHRLPLAHAADAFAKFDSRSDGYIKIVLEP